MMIRKYFKPQCIIGLLFGLGLSILYTNTYSAESVSDENKLVEKIKDAVIKDLRESGALDKEIEAGIERYIRKQREAQASASSQQAKNVRAVSVDRDHIFGNPDAEISLIEYSDFECPYCKRFHNTAKQIVDAYDGRVNWVYRHFPLGFHNPGAQKEAEASECAAELGGNDAFWKFSDLIYQRTRSNGKGFPIANLVPLAKEIGLDDKKFKECLDSNKYAGRVQEDLKNGIESGVSGTPGNFILNNKTGAIRVKPGALPFENMKKEIDSMLNQ